MERLLLSITRTENLGDNTSGFTGEQQAVDRLVANIKATNGPSIVLIDELGHHARSSMGGDYNLKVIFDDLMPLHNALKIVTTHYTEPVMMAKELPDSACMHEEFIVPGTQEIDDLAEEFASMLSLPKDKKSKKELLPTENIAFKPLTAAAAA